MFTLDAMLVRSVTLAFVLAAVSMGGVARAEKDEHAGHHPVADGAPTDEQRGAQDVEALMARITASAERGQRMELLTQHLAALRAQMKRVRAAASRPDAEGRGAASGQEKESESAQGAPGGDSAGKRGKMGGMMGGKMKGGMMKKHQQIEGRIDMLERMLQQLIEYEAVERELEQGEAEE